MKAYKYKVEVETIPFHSYGNIDIEEIFIPEYGIVFNEKNGCFKIAEPRNKNYKEIEIAGIDAEMLNNYIAEKENMEKICNKYFKKEKKK